MQCSRRIGCTNRDGYIDVTSDGAAEMRGNGKNWVCNKQAFLPAAKTENVILQSTAGILQYNVI